MASRAIQSHVKAKQASEQNPQPCPSARTTQPMSKSFNTTQKTRAHYIVTGDKSVKNVDQKGMFVEPSSSLATTVIKDITMERKLPAWVNVASSSRQSTSQPPDDIDLELSLRCSASVSYSNYTRCLDKLLASVESPKGLPDGPIANPGPKLKRFKLDDSSNSCAQLAKYEEKSTKLFGTIIKTSSEQAPDERGSKVTMPIVIAESDGEVSVQEMMRNFARSWVHNRSKVVMEPEEVVTGPKSWRLGPPGSPERDHEEQHKTGGVTIWNFDKHKL
ncbi:hypothetical protein CASFOL_042215 [Castilleja foliolosa]|uniref:Uncharacterized protein n=1 Tax=Castilleja foliolosa TaxID=1961234 RepID=A0ABD3BAM1_9LAMI